MVLANNTQQLIRQLGDPVLHTPGHPVDFSLHQRDIQQQLAIMHHTRKVTGGIGIAANQCAQIENPLAIIIVGINKDDFAATKRYQQLPLPEEFILINPSLVAVSHTTHLLAGGEGCLSVSGCLRGDIERYKSITVSYYDANGNFFENAHFTDMTAIIVQHELAHILHGQVYLQSVIEKLTPLQQQQLKKLIAATLQTTTSDTNINPNLRDHVFKLENGQIQYDENKLRRALNNTPQSTLMAISYYLATT